MRDAGCRNLTTQDIREFLVYSYCVVYRVQPDQILIAAVIHGRRILQ